MTLYLENSGSFSPWTGQEIDSIKHPLSIEQLWSAEDLEVFGLYLPAPADPVPDGKVASSSAVSRVGGVVKFVNTLEDAPPPPTASPLLYAAAQLQIVDYDITGIEINSRLGGAFWLDTGKYGVFFSQSQPDTSYMVQASAGPCSAYVLPTDKTEDFFTVTVTDFAGQPTDAAYVNLSITRAL